MPDGEETRLAVVVATMTESLLAIQGNLATRGDALRLLGFAYGPGDLVLDTVTGLTGTVLHAAHHTLIRNAPAT